MTYGPCFHTCPHISSEDRVDYLFTLCSRLAAENLHQVFYFVRPAGFGGDADVGLEGRVVECDAMHLFDSLLGWERG